MIGPGEQPAVLKGEVRHVATGIGAYLFGRPGPAAAEEARQAPHSVSAAAG